MTTFFSRLAYRLLLCSIDLYQFAIRQPVGATRCDQTLPIQSSRRCAMRTHMNKFVLVVLAVLMASFTVTAAASDPAWRDAGSKIRNDFYGTTAPRYTTPMRTYRYVAPAMTAPAPVVRNSFSYAPEAAKANAPTEKAAAPAADAWRFVRHEGRWWYYLPSGKFVYWNGTTWVNPVVAGNTAVRRYSYEPTYEPAYTAPMGGGYRAYTPYRDPAWRGADSKIKGF